MRKVFIVDDDQAIVDMLKEEIEQAIEGVACVFELDFAQAVARVKSERPDAVILDLLDGGVTADPPGQHTWQSIWTGRFCPVIVYTAFGGPLTPPVPDSHPFVKLVVKGVGTQAAVVQHLRDFTPLVAAIESVHREVDAVLQRVLRDTVGAAVIPGTEAAHLVHAARRRVAAMMDEKTATEGRTLFSWEQYLVPALGGDPLTGDVLRRRGAAPTDPTAFRIVLSPSCDLVVGRNEPTVLVAKCSSVDRMKQRLQLSPTNAQRAANAIKSQVLTQGHWSGYLPLPAFPGRIPLMVANLKDLEVIQFSAIQSTEGESEYERVASIDSPFREQVAWAFLTTVARPGMPDRDLGPWANEIANAQPVTAPPAAAAAPPAPDPQPAAAAQATPAVIPDVQRVDQPPRPNVQPPPAPGAVPEEGK